MIILPRTYATVPETLHIQSNTCNCSECQEKRNKYITILDVDRYIESLNDWD